MSKWISVKEKMPEPIKVEGCVPPNSIFVDVYGDGERWPNCSYSPNDEKWVDEEGFEVTIDVTHWRYVPEPPELEAMKPGSITMTYNEFYAAANALNSAKHVAGCYGRSLGEHLSLGAGHQFIMPSRNRAFTQKEQNPSELMCNVSYLQVNHDLEVEIVINLNSD